MAEYSYFDRFNQIFPLKSGLLSKKVAFYSKWHYNQEWPSIYTDTVYEAETWLRRLVTRQLERPIRMFSSASQHNNFKNLQKKQHTNFT